jgi:hypothetical protein
MLPIHAKGMWIGTFHGLCNRFLRAHWKIANLPQAFQILDTQDQLSCIKRLYKEFKVDEERYPAKQTMWFIAGSKEEGLRPEQIIVKDSDTRKLVELYQLYEAQCQKEGVVDFAELMLRSYELLRDNESLRVHYQTRFKHILIDEFQDTNKLQYAWLKLLCGPDSSMFAVGDDDLCKLRRRELTHQALRCAQHQQPLRDQLFGRQRRVAGALQADELGNVFQIHCEHVLSAAGDHRDGAHAKRHQLFAAAGIIEDVDGDEVDTFFRKKLFRAEAAASAGLREQYELVGAGVHVRLGGL